MIFQDIVAGFGTAWRLRWPIWAVHLGFNLALGLLLVPLMALAVRLALSFAGQPALADFDIAYFLLSPVGFICFLLLAGLALFLFVLDLALMMAVGVRARSNGQPNLSDAVALVLPRAVAIIKLGVWLTLRILALSLPFLAVAGAIYVTQLTAFDINYYLSQRPPEFLRAVVLIGGVLALLVLVLGRALVRWTLVLPLVLFEGVSPRAAFSQSALEMKGSEIGFALRIAGWLIGATVIGAVPLAVIGAVADATVSGFDGRLSVLVAMLGLFAGLGALANFVVTGLSTGALAALIMARAGWPDARLTESARDMPRWGLALVAGAALGAAVLGGIGLVGLARFETSPRVQVIAHRGAAGAAPENTMAAFARAIEVGADWVELDVQESGDGDVVVVHDSDFMKIAGVNLKIWDATQADLARIDIGGWFDPAFSDQRTPLLRDALELARGRAGVVIELKYYGHDERLEERVVEIVEDLDMVEQVKIMSLKYDAVRKMRALRPDWEIGLLATASLGRMWELDVDFLAVNSAAVSHRMVRETRAAGKDLYVWTINDALSMSQMVSMGVDGLITDEPELAGQVLAERHELNTLERMVLGLAGSLGLDMRSGEYRDESP